jgi:TrmH family RNA methyltransferase
MPVSFRKISSKANEEIKTVRALVQRKHREETGLFMTEGLRHALEAAEAGWEFQSLVIEEEARATPLVQRLLKLCDKQNILCLEVTPAIMEGITKRDNAQNVIAVLKQQWTELAAVKDGLWIALEEIRDPGNLGTIMRTADAVGARGIILIENTCDRYSLEAIRASMGSFPHMKMVRCRREEFADWAKGSGFQIIGTHLKTDHDYRGIEYKKPLILLMGNEQAGLTDRLSGVCTGLVKIPMQGKADSLNVSVATAVMLFEINRAELKI